MGMVRSTATVPEDDSLRRGSQSIPEPCLRRPVPWEVVETKKPQCQSAGGLPLVRTLLALEIASTGRAATNQDGAARADPTDEHREPTLGCCVKKTRERHAVRKMKEDPSEPSCRGRLQTAISCFGQKPRW